MRGTFVMRNGRLVRKDRARPLNAGPMTISDDLGSDLEHHGYADGRRTASKSEFRRWTKQAGLEEKGNDRERPKPLRDPNLSADVARSIQMLRQGYVPQYKMVEGLDG
jgi:hypothetical protein